MEIEYRLRIWDGDEEHLLSEAELMRALPLDWARQIAQRKASGQVVLRHYGMPEFAAEDELEALIIHLCGVTIPHLIAGRMSEIRYYVHFGGFKLIPETQLIRLVKDGENIARYPRKEFIAALRACGERYLAFAKRIHRGDQEWSQTLEELERELLMKDNAGAA